MPTYEGYHKLQVLVGTPREKSEEGVYDKKKKERRNERQREVEEASDREGFD